ncbi:MAG TPA: response regulator transcription factor [bacterium]|nr:response regulator transcription factor [bacterium]
MSSSGHRRQRVLVVDDERDLQELVSYNLRKAGWEVTLAGDGATALREAFGSEFDAAVLDLMLPDMDGMEICRQLRAEPKTRRLPIIMLTARAEVGEKVRGLEAGADDYLGKPFDVAELIARVRALLRRSQPEPSAAIRLGNLLVDESRFLVEIDGRRVELTQKEFQLLLLFVRHRGKVLTRDQIIEDVWGHDYFGGTRTIDVHIKRIRGKLEGMQPVLTTKRGLGYMLEETGSADHRGA